MSKPIDLTIVNRRMIGFDHLVNNLAPSANYPPCNVIKYSERQYCIEIAVAGFDKSDVSVFVDQDTLIVKGKTTRIEESNIEYLYRGLASRSFEQTFTLAEHMVVSSAAIENGILHIYISRIIPDSNTLKQIEII
jgi:molecular chaperone IbpA